MQIHHIALRVADLDRAATFYREVLELEWDCHQLDDQGRMRAVWFKLGEQGETLLMLEKGGVSPGASIPTLLALTIGAAERPQWIAKLRKHGVAIRKESPYSVYFTDPDDNPLALSHHPIAL